MTTDPSALPDLLADAHALLPEMIDVRRRLHRRPEVGLALPAPRIIEVCCPPDEVLMPKVLAGDNMGKMWPYE